MENRRAGIVIVLLPIALVVVAVSSYAYWQANEQLIVLHQITGPITNPLMGWAPWATIKESSQPHTLVYADLTWREFEPQEGQFDFDTFEEKQQLARWREEGKRVVFRFVADKPGKEKHLDIPDWLFEKIHGDGDYYDTEYGMGFSPDYSNPILINHHQNAITALGQRYGADGFFAFIELGSLGHWGEWHTHPDIAPLPSEDIRDLYVQHYVAAFPRTHLLMRRPFAIARRLGLGLYNDMAGAVAPTNTWLDWIEHGGEYLSSDGNGLAAMPDGWRKAPIGGEQPIELGNDQMYGADLEQTLELLRKSHTTFVGPESPYKVEYGSSLQGGIDQVLAAIGYRLYVDRVQMPRWVYFGSSLTIWCTVSNSGIAPMYYDWPLYFYLFDANGVPIRRGQLEFDIRQVLPNERHELVFKVQVGDLKDGTYSVGIAILDPSTDQPAVRFANENVRADLVQYLGTFEVRNLFKPH